MKRWLIPFGILLAMTGLLFGSAQIPTTDPPVTPDLVSGARVSLICPALSSESVEWRIVGASKQGLLLHSELDTQPKDEPTDLLKLAGSAVVQRITSPRSDEFATIGWVAQPDGPERGLSAVSCASGQGSWWFAGMQLNVNATAELTLYNPDITDAAVELAIYDAKGQVAAAGARGIVVRAHSYYSVPLSVMNTPATPIANAPFAVHVETSTGRVVPFIREHTWKGSEPVSTAWIPPMADPAETQTIPGIPEGDGTRELILVNPGEKSVRVSVDLLGTEGRSVLPGANAVEVPAQTTQRLDLSDALAGQSGSLQVTATEGTVAAAMILDSGIKADIAYAVGSRPIGESGLWVLPAGKKAESVLEFANPGEIAATVQVALSEKPSAEPEVQQVMVPAGSTLRLELPKRDITIIELATDSPDVRAATTSRLPVGGLDGLAILQLSQDRASVAPPTITFDPHIGSIAE